MPVSLNPQQNVSSIQQVQSTKVEPKNTSNKPMNTTTKVLIGAGALATIVVGGLLYRNKIAGKKAADALVQAAKEKLKNLKTQKSVNAGETVAETIENILGKNSSIKPHSYDTSLEFHTIPCYRNFGGYKDGWVTKAGIIEDFNENIPNARLISSSITHCQNLKLICSTKKHGINIYKGFVEGTKNRVVRFEMDDPSCCINETPTKVIFSIISPNSKYTPVQQDLIKLSENPKKIDVSVFDIIFKFKNDIRDGRVISREDILKYYGKYENLDYDLILSAIQSMVK